jgi:hypothetical protein
MGRLWCTAGVFLVMAGMTAASFAQQPAQKTTSSQPPATTALAKPDSDKPADAPPTPATPANAHQAQIVADTQKLVKLSQELKAEVAKSNKDTLSLSVIKKAEEMEKLARTLKEELNKSH